MNYELLTVEETDDLAETLKQLRNKGVRRRVPVADDGSMASKTLRKIGRYRNRQELSREL